MTREDLDMLASLFPVKEKDEYDLQIEAEKAKKIEDEKRRHEMMMDESSVWYNEEYARKMTGHKIYSVNIKTCEIVDPR